MKKTIFFLITFLITSNAYAKPPVKAGQWGETKGSQEEILKQMQKRILILDKRDEKLRLAVGDLRDRIYYFECKYEKAC